MLTRRDLAALLCAYAAFGCAGIEFGAPPPHEITTTHFRLISQPRPADGRSAASALEHFHAAVLELSGLDEPPDAPRVTVYYFADRSSLARFHRLDSKNRVAGFFVQATTGTAIAAAHRQYSYARWRMANAYHEYIHYLRALTGQARSTRWFEEGLANLYASMRVHRRFVRFTDFTPHPGPLAFSLDEFLQPELFGALEREGRLVPYYLQATAFVRFLELGHLSGHRDRRGDVDRFLDELESGAGPDEASRAAFSISVAALQEEFETYMATPLHSSLRVPRSTKWQRVDPRVREMKPGEADAAFGLLAYQSRRWPTARHHFRKALDADSSNARALAGLARLSDDWGAAGDLIARALDADPTDALVRAWAGDLRLASAARERSSDAKRAALVDEAREHYYASLGANPGIQVARIGLATASAQDGRDLEASIEGMQAVRAAFPGSVRMALLTARLKLMSGDAAGAKRELRNRGAPHAKRRQEEVEALLAEIERVLQSGQPGR